MCGIMGYIGDKEALPILLQGLRRLEYRGYDSAGVAVAENGKLKRVRAVGKIENLIHKSKGDELAGTMGIAHTRWATHGEVTEKNAHPHVAAVGKLAIVHNGIIENYRELKKELGESVQYSSETDTEVLAHLIAKYYQGDLFQAVREALGKVRGTYGILVIHADEPNYLVAARLGSPLVVGVGNGEYFVASDITPLLTHTKEVIYLDDGEVARVNHQNIRIANLLDEEIKKGTEKIEWNEEQARKQGYEHFMLKEIMEQPVVFEDAIRGRTDFEQGTAHLGGLNMTEDEMRGIRRIIIIACGTASYAGMVGQFAFERLAGIPTTVEIASEFRYREPVLDSRTLVFVISQSGETADTLMALREAKRKGAVVRGIVNVVGSTIAREAGAGTYIHAGPELAVASTKAYTNMIAILALYALQFGRLHHTTVATGQRVLKALTEIPTKMNTVLDQRDEIRKIAEAFKNYKNFFYLGRGINYPVALEGSLKLKEISYIHSEAYPGGELKHGPIALIDENFPVVAILTQNQLYEKMKNNVQEVLSRKAKVIIIANEGDSEISELSDQVIYLPRTMELLEPLLNTIPLQLFAYYMALTLDRDVDRPRNLAKSVTVE